MNNAENKLAPNFTYFIKRINPSPTYEQAAASAHSQITSLIENREGPAGDLRIKCFLQGSYKQETAIHTINDVDIVALCSLSYSPSANQKTRDQIFEMIAAAIAENATYKDIIRHRKRSICIKVELEGVKLEILPAIREKGKPFEYEPFYIFRPNENESLDGNWDVGFARIHQKLITNKNVSTGGLFVPMIKVLKHLRSIDPKFKIEDAISFHIECLLYALKDSIYEGSTCECLESVLKALAGFSSDKAIKSQIKSPCREKLLFDSSEWNIEAYARFHEAVIRWHNLTSQANREPDKEKAIDIWINLLGETYFPREPQ